MEQERVISNVNSDVLHRILIYLPFSEIKEMYLVSPAFAYKQNREEFHFSLLEEQFGLPVQKKANFREFYITLRRLMAKIKAIYPVPNNPPPVTEAQMYSSIREQQKRYETVNVDACFLLVKSLLGVIKESFELGGMTYYHFRELYRTFEDELTNFEVIPLFPEIILGNMLIFADFNNVVGLGDRQRYILHKLTHSKMVLLKHNEDYLKEGVLREIQE